MIVSCKMSQCPYHDKYDFCARPTVVSIDQNGMCNVLWRKGQRRTSQMPFTEQFYPKDKVIIVEGAVKEVSDSIKEESEEDAGSRLEDPINGTAAQNGDN